MREWNYTKVTKEKAIAGDIIYIRRHFILV